MDGAGIESRESIITYWSLRIGILGAVLLLAVSVLYERTRAPGCWQTSISAYFYTPVRSVFVGALVAVGLCLIVIQGRSKVEDIGLNLAGMMAPLVAFVPTSGAGNCSSVPPEPPTVVRDGKEVIADWVIAGVKNNVFALTVTGLVAVVAAIALVRANDRPLVEGVSGVTRLGRLTLSLIVSLVVVALGTVLFLLTDVEMRAHFVAAILMFVFFGVVVVNNFRRCRSPRYKRIYGAIAVLMPLALVLLLVPDWDHSVLVLEIVEIVLFAAFWAVQTAELWSIVDKEAALSAA